VPISDGRHRLASREMTTRIGHVFPLKDAAKAHRIVETGHSGGEVILIP
jgi:NADPH:quinone reductase-like Zn-dependent oxidoreductase